MCNILESVPQKLKIAVEDFMQKSMNSDKDFEIIKILPNNEKHSDFCVLLQNKSTCVAIIDSPKSEKILIEFMQKEIINRFLEYSEPLKRYIINKQKFELGTNQVESISLEEMVIVYLELKKSIRRTMEEIEDNKSGDVDYLQKLVSTSTKLFEIFPIYTQKNILKMKDEEAEK